MRRAKRPVPVELGVAMIILVAAVAADLFWVRPRERELGRLATRMRAAERSAELAQRERGEREAIQAYLNRGDAGEEAWKSRYAGADPLRLLDGTRERAGLRRLDLRLVEEAPASPFTRTTYYLSENGSFERQIDFLRELELAQPLATVESFVMDSQDGNPGVNMKLNVSLLTLREGEGR